MHCFVRKEIITKIYIIKILAYRSLVVSFSIHLVYSISMVRLPHFIIYLVLLTLFCFERAMHFCL
jgi:hypothetical protein